MTADTTTTINGVRYLSVPQPNKGHPCRGCVADNDVGLCHQFSECIALKCIYIKQDEPVKVEVTMISVPQIEWDAYMASRQVVNDFAARSLIHREAMARAQASESPPLARNTDPATSHTAAMGMARKAGHIRDLILIELRDNGAMTGTELSTRTGVALNSVTPRFAQLRRAGLIHAAGGAKRETIWAIGDGVAL